LYRTAVIAGFPRLFFSFRHVGEQYFDVIENYFLKTATFRVIIPSRIINLYRDDTGAEYTFSKVYPIYIDVYVTGTPRKVTTYTRVSSRYIDVFDDVKRVKLTYDRQDGTMWLGNRLIVKKFDELYVVMDREVYTDEDIFIWGFPTLYELCILR